MRPKAKSTIASQKSRANNLIVLVEFLLKFNSNKGFQLFLDVLVPDANIIEGGPQAKEKVLGKRLHV